MKMRVKKIIKLVIIIEFIIFLANLLSFEFFINLQIAFLSSFFIILGSSYAYKKALKSEVNIQNANEERELLDTIEDPYELYDEIDINDVPADELDLKAIVKEEKKKIKILNLRDIKKGSRASVSLFRLVPYLFLILGFIALKNNEVLDISIYLPSLLIGIIIGYIVSKDLF